MPVATQGTLKGLTPEQLEATGCRLCLNNTYHLGLRPGQAVLDKIGGAHRLQSWPHNILTGLLSLSWSCIYFFPHLFADGLGNVQIAVGRSSLSSV